METVPTVDRALNPSATDLPSPDPALMESANTRALVAIGGQFVYIAWLVALMAAGVVGYALPSDEAITFWDVALSIAVFVMFLVWKWAAYKAAMQMSPEPLDSTPGWAVGVYVIPIANLWLPYVRMREIQQAAEMETADFAGEEGSSAGIVIAWWISWIGSTVGTRLIEAAGPSDTSYTWIAVVALTVGSGLLTALVAYRMNRAQQAQAAAREADGPVSMYG